MKNLIYVHCKRFLFRWETFAVTLLNILFALIGTIAAALVYEPNGLFNKQFYDIIETLTVISLFCTMSAVIFIEINTLATGAVRNPLIAGYSKSKVFLSKYLAVAVFSIAEGAICILPPVPANDWTEGSVRYTVTVLFMYAAVSCIAMSVCLLTDRPAVYMIVTIGAFAGLLYGGSSAAYVLDQPSYRVSVAEDGSLVKEPTRWSVNPPYSDMIDGILKISPVQPIYEYFDWYFPKYDTLSRNLGVWKEKTEQAANETEAEAYRMHLNEIESAVHFHMGRIESFPYCQFAVFALICAGGTLVFKKRNLK